MDWCGKVGEAQLFQLASVMLSAPSPAHVFAVDLLLAGQSLGRADPFGYKHRIHDATVIEVLADLVPGCDLALTLVNDVFEGVLDRREVLADATEI